MKNDVRYLGSVRFYKHLILFIIISAILLPIVGMFVIFTQYWELKHHSYRIVLEQQLYIGRLEERVACLEEQQKDRPVISTSEEQKSEQAPETPGTEEITDEETAMIPFYVNREEVKYILVNDNNSLPQSYQPDLVETNNGQLVHREIKDSLEEMICDAKKEGFDLIICSAYRDYEKQASLMDESIQRYVKEGCDYTEAYWNARRYLEMVGKSEHHTGLAVDLVGIGHQTLDDEQAYTPESIWLNEHAHKYGFILRYPRNKEEITGILYESWHFRYVGEQAAAFMKQHDLCLEEFLDLVNRQGEKNERN